MAGAPDERGPGPAAREQLQQQHVGCRVFSEPPAQGMPQQGFLSSFPTSNQKCQLMLLKTLETNPYVKLLLDAMKYSGCAVNKERHFSCEDCNGNVSGGFDASVSQIVLCQNNIRNQAHMSRVVTHELVHAFDHCRAHVDWFTNVRHLACSEVRAANLSGDCSLVNEIFRLHFGLKQHHQLFGTSAKKSLRRLLMKFLSLVSMTMNLSEGSHITRRMQDTLTETFRTGIGTTQTYEDNDVLYHRASASMRKVRLPGGQTCKT
nr:mitochondrial inner membrane protease ATP23 homolog isoform X1 [Camelus bactrianus]